MIEHSPAQFISDIDGFKKFNPDVKTVDPINQESVDEIIIASYGKTRFEDAEMRDLADSILNDPEYGNWVHYPWRNEAVRFPDQGHFYDVRTSRNRQMITRDEQQILESKRLAVLGLSVGSNVALSAVQLGMRPEYLADRDTISMSNLNRIRAHLGDVGLRKTEWLGRELALIDPYIKQVQISDGYTEAMNDVMDNTGVDMLVEEVDDLVAKARIRQYAKERRIPLVSVGDFGENSVVDIERHDREDIKPFNGKLTKGEYEALVSGDLNDKQAEKLRVKIVGMKNIAPRLLESVMDPDLDGLPQLGTTVAIGAGMGASAIANIFLDRNDSSGTFKVNQRKALGLKPQQGLLNAARTWQKFITRKKS